jgi:putative iron-regulated protein
MLKCYGAALAAACLVCTNAAAQTPRAVLEHYAAIAHASYEDSLTSARTLQKAIDAFLAAPSAQTHAEAKKAWLAGREWYGQTEAFRFYGGPIDGKDGPEGRINAWPMDEAYVDYVKGKPNAGLINNPKQPITRKLLVSLNEKGGEENISTGWHAIEFVLWGADMSADGPGARSFEDFVDGKGPNAARRRQYLKTATDLLIDDLAGLVKAWSPKAKNYRAGFVRNSANVAKVLTGIGVLTRSELAGERMEVALDSRDQEDEHSCFSDNTHRDIVANAIGIRNVWRGQYRRLDGTALVGPGLRNLVVAKDAALAQEVDQRIDASVAAAEAIPAPFDAALAGDDNSPGRKSVRVAVEALKAQADALAKAAQVLGTKRLNMEVPK